MGLDIFDFMKAGGAGLQVVADKKETKRKEDFLAKLEDKRHAQDEQDKINAEARAQKAELNKPLAPRLVTDGDGVMWSQIGTAGGGIISKTLADSGQVADAKFADAEQKGKLEAILANTKESIAHADYYAGGGASSVTKPMTPLQQSQIAYNNARTNAVANAPPKVKAGPKITESARTRTLITKARSALKRLGDTPDNRAMIANSMRDAGETQAAIEAFLNGLD